MDAGSFVKCADYALLTVTKTESWVGTFTVVLSAHSKPKHRVEEPLQLFINLCHILLQTDQIKNALTNLMHLSRVTNFSFLKGLSKKLGYPCTSLKFRIFYLECQIRHVCLLYVIPALMPCNKFPWQQVLVTTLRTGYFWYQYIFFPNQDLQFQKMELDQFVVVNYVSCGK